jgi:predicted dehydrogenase
MNPLKLAVVGLGLIGKKHAAIIQKNQQMELCGIVENNKIQIKNANIKSKFFDNIQ